MSGDSEVVCPICGAAISLDAGRYADETGKAVHETCSLTGLAPAKTQVSGNSVLSKTDLLI